MTPTYYCSDCDLFLQISIVPDPNRPPLGKWVQPKGILPETCPMCGDSACFGEVGEEDP